MSLGTIGRAMHATRKQMLTMATTEVAERLHEVFGLKIGDFVEISAIAGERLVWKKARIIEAVSCYANANNGYTAWLKVIPSNHDGRLGCSRSVMAVVNRRGEYQERSSTKQCRPLSGNKFSTAK
jgi:hypothetical protein